MLVDRQPERVRTLEDALARQGHEVVAATGAGQELLADLERHHPDAAVLASEDLRSILEDAVRRRRELQQLRAELDQTRVQLSERKLVERAKGIVMKKKGLSEDLAYRALRKMAMDRNLKLSDLARSVIAAADLLE